MTATEITELRAEAVAVLRKWLLGGDLTARVEAAVAIIRMAPEIDEVKILRREVLVMFSADPDFHARVETALAKPDDDDPD